jgi:hypothetical protein
MVLQFWEQVIAFRAKKTKIRDVGSLGDRSGGEISTALHAFQPDT